MSTYDVTIIERVHYSTTVEAESEEEALELARKELTDSDGPESAFGSPDYSETDVDSATKR